ncbi:MAG: DNA repair protein RecO [Bacteroidota bacterium]|nr:DNA repair protein RecO [Bacteroidota bacterium]
MLVKTKALIISVVKYKDTSLIVRCLTHSDGLKSYIVKGVYGSSKSRLHPSYFGLLTIVEIEAQHKNKGGLEYIKSLRPILSCVGADINKTSQVFFLAEVLSLLLVENDNNGNLFDFLENRLTWFYTQGNNPDFYLHILAELTQYVGFYPNVSSGDYFDLEQGVFLPYESLTTLDRADSDLFKKLFTQISYNNSKEFSRTERAKLLDIILKYYAAHVDGFRKSKSLQVLKEVFH